MGEKCWKHQERLTWGGGGGGGCRGGKEERGREEGRREEEGGKSCRGEGRREKGRRRKREKGGGQCTHPHRDARVVRDCVPNTIHTQWLYRMHTQHHLNGPGQPASHSFTVHGQEDKPNTPLSKLGELPWARCVAKGTVRC